MLYVTCTMISSVDLEHHGVSHAKDWVSVHCGTTHIISEGLIFCDAQNVIRYNMQRLWDYSIGQTDTGGKQGIRGII